MKQYYIFIFTIFFSLFSFKSLSQVVMEFECNGELVTTTVCDLNGDGVLGSCDILELFSDICSEFSNVINTPCDEENLDWVGGVVVDWDFNSDCDDSDWDDWGDGDGGDDGDDDGDDGDDGDWNFGEDITFECNNEIITVSWDDFGDNPNAWIDWNGDGLIDESDFLISVLEEYDCDDFDWNDWGDGDDGDNDIDNDEWNDIDWVDLGWGDFDWVIYWDDFNLGDIDWENITWDEIIDLGITPDEFIDYIIEIIIGGGQPFNWNDFIIHYGSPMDINDNIFNDRHIIQTVNTIGQLVNSETKGIIVINIYSDGMVERKHTIK